MNTETFSFEVTDDHGRVIGHGTVSASDRIKAVAAVRMVRLDSLHSGDTSTAV